MLKSVDLIELFQSNANEEEIKKRFQSDMAIFLNISPNRIFVVRVEFGGRRLLEIGSSKIDIKVS